PWSLLDSPARAEEARPPAAAQPSVADLARRVSELEDIIRQMRAEHQGGRPGASLPLPAGPQAEPEGTSGGQADSRPSTTEPPPVPGKPGDSAGADRGERSGEKTFTAGWKDDAFAIQSADKNFYLRFTGQVQADYRSFLEEGDRTDIDTFLIRRARFGLEATMAQYYEFRLLPDFGQGRAVVQDAYMNIHYWDAFQFEVGKFKQPVSYEQLIQDRFVPTAERSLIDQLVPARDEGAMIHGQNLFCGRLDWAFAVSNGEINGDTDTNEHKDVNGRVVVRPFYRRDSASFLNWLGVGVSGGVGVEQELVSPATLRTPLTVPWFQFNPGVRADGVRWRLSPELSYFYRSFGLAAQYYAQEQKLRPSLTGPASRLLIDVPAEGGYVMATYLLTGEERTTYSAPVKPLHPFDPCHPWACPGAWELVGRVSRLDESDVVFARGLARLADPTRFSDGATEMTLGFNWYLNAWVRMQMNWEHAWFDQAVQLGSGASGLTRDSDALVVRFQIIF
ncbi:MAG TPA: porin, partial [Gemmataceae bacterium]|nr:porin [Gemmataceae bacterium]